jgi:thermitase
VSGIIGAVAIPAAGISGVTHHISIMALRYYSDQSSGEENFKNSVRAMRYAVENGARIINYSGGGSSFNQEEYEVLKKAEQAGVLLVAAAGNEHSNTDGDQSAFYPACYPLKNIISVASTDIRNNLIPSSNWGKNTVHVGAPGKGILSILPNYKVGLLTGTSQATAFVTGIAALLWAHFPNLTVAQVKHLIEFNVDRLDQLRDKVRSGGRVNAYKALTQTSR